MYNTRTWLNPLGHSSTGYIICFDNTVNENGYEYDDSYIKIGDCKNGVTLHKWNAELNAEEMFLNKLKLMSNEINNFIKYLENKNNSK